MRVYERRVSRMRRWVAVWLAWSLAGVSAAMFVGSIVLFVLFWMFFALGDVSNAYELAMTGKVTSSVRLDALTQGTWVPPVGLLGIYMILLFPDGRLPSRRWR